MEPDGASRETAGSVRDWLSRTLLATRLPSLSKKRWNFQRVPELALPTRLARGRTRCLFRRLCRPNSDGLLDAVEHAGAVLFPGGAVFRYHSDTGGQRLSPSFADGAGSLRTSRRADEWESGCSPRARCSPGSGTITSPP